MTFMAADMPNSMEHTRAGFAMSLSGDDEDKLCGYWDGLSDGGTVVMALEPAPWGDVFGMCIDKFGINWMVNVAGAGS